VAELDEVALAYATTVHKSQGSEYPAVVIPRATQHYPMLARNLLYTGVTRGKQLVLLIGQPKACALAVRNARHAAADEPGGTAAAAARQRVTRPAIVPSRGPVTPDGALPASHWLLPRSLLFPPRLDERHGERGTQQGFQACLVHADEIEREQGSQRFRTGV
jgi:UvrD-like helicase C-terminal domain